jgi:hypothetical protein
MDTPTLLNGISSNCKKPVRSERLWKLITQRNACGLKPTLNRPLNMEPRSLATIASRSVFSRVRAVSYLVWVRPLDSKKATALRVIAGRVAEIYRTWQRSVLHRPGYLAALARTNDSTVESCATESAAWRFSASSISLRRVADDFRYSHAGILTRLSDEGTTHNFSGLHIKFAAAVDAGHVLAFLLSGAHGNMDFLAHLTVWALNTHLISGDSGDTL